jgi:superfamily II DNA or RNA helicase
MPHEAGEQMQPGLSEEIVTASLREWLDTLEDPRLAILSEVDPDEAHTAVAQHLERLIASSMSTLRGAEATDRRRRLVDRVIDTLISELGEDWSGRFRLVDPLQRLLAVRSNPAAERLPRPDTPLARSALLTGTRLDPSLASQLSKEFASADRVDILCSFVKWSGVRLLFDAFRELTRSPHPQGPRLRVISTSYMGATDVKAIEAIRELPNTEVRLSYDTTRTRLHAKAYIVHRATGFGSAYVGSANISRAALSEGLEWTSKISQFELPYLWKKIVATFESYWNDPDFERYEPDSEARLRTAIDHERSRGSGDAINAANFDLRPFPFQESILDALSAERAVQSKQRQLVVAATGTGKTMIAAFDYRRWGAGSRPPLLFIAHREEILRQALATFRAVLRDQNFGDLLVGSHEPAQLDHLFCSIQSYNARGLTSLPPDRHDYVVVDEFHHAAAESYQRLLDRVQPKVLLGLTATPERADGRSVLDWFGGEATAEIRLADAIARRLLSSFQYFGISDCVDLDALAWQRGGYRAEDLDRLYSANKSRAELVLSKVHELLLDVHAARGVGFCVSVRHAEFMATFFSEHGVPAVALSATTPDDVRRSVRDRLVRREVNFIFVVDLYNEGVDIPELDTVLFLRPTESLTVFLQQLGRGLRLHHEKDCLTVLDFIGAQHRRFRFASRFRALGTDPAVQLDREIEAGFPHLPPGCFIRLERVASQRVLENVRQALTPYRPRIIADLREYGRALGRAPSLREALDYLSMPLDELLKRGSWQALLHAAGLAPAVEGSDLERIEKGVRRLAHVDDPVQIKAWLAALRSSQPTDPVSRHRLAMLLTSLWGPTGVNMSLESAMSSLLDRPSTIRDLTEVLEYRLAHTRTAQNAEQSQFQPLALHASYTRDEALIGLGYWSFERRPDVREGTVHLRESKLDIFFITLNKTAEAYSPTTMYEDYVISDSLFHWQSQSTTSVESPTGQRYLNHRAMGYTPLLFVRDSRQTPGGLSAPYTFLGAADFVSHEGSRPISIVWRLRTPMPARVLLATAV